MFTFLKNWFARSKKQPEPSPVEVAVVQERIRMDDKVWQEFYCNDCPDGGNYILVRLNLALKNYTVVVVCPMCGAKHHRTINEGRIVDDSKSGSVIEEICPPKSACSKESRTAKMFANARHGVVVEEDDAKAITRAMLRERWIELYGGGGYGGQE
jgi:RNase P subunit RPR2